MKLYYNKNSKDPIYYAQMGYRNGNKTTTKNVERIGRHSELLKITDDPLAYAKTRIEELNKQNRSGRSEFSLTVDFNQTVLPSDDALCSSTVSNIGYFYLKSIYSKLQLDKFFKQITNDLNISYDCNEICQFLTYARIFDPCCEYGTYDKLDTYFEKPQIKDHQLIRFLDILEENSAAYLKHLSNIANKDASIIYYDCKNYILNPDEEIIDEVTGEVIKGIRQFHRPNPSVNMGLIMDNRGIPISMCIDPSNTNFLEENVLKMTGNRKFIYCADASLDSYNLPTCNSNDDYILTQSITKLSEPLKQAIFNDYGYHLLSDDSNITLEFLKTFDKKDIHNISYYNDVAYKVIYANPILEIPTLNNGTSKQSIIITFSRKMMEYQRTIRNKQIIKAKELLQLENLEKIKNEPNDIIKYLKPTSTSPLEYVLDEAKIKEEEKYNGFYAVTTNLDEPAKEILNILNNKYKLEEYFCIMKNNFKTKPVAHLCICYTALLICRLMECQLEDNQAHVTSINLIHTLKNMNVANIEDLYYMSLYKGSKTLKALEKTYHLCLDKKYYRPKDLNKLKKV